MGDKMNKDKQCEYCEAKESPDAKAGEWQFECKCYVYLKVGILPDLYKRAKKIKFTDGQLACFTDPKSLEMTCDRIELQAANMANRRAE